ncbi:DUF2306 domain-containing protein [Marinicella sp. S1101]|uniref:DUF2306 domain-containing protein n=1 Tax=Marinicella marina TaxID=2996016 RepID=UPI002260D57E|nr:DUF2306 domain-containing protein [Marinicella marina]MCX7552912.1 DUF2306 domain-containing protein [Marinicella marina]MDJ1139779.1 DUF2306 domain-containing protein [Marinicella marina]
MKKFLKILNFSTYSMMSFAVAYYAFDYYLQLASPVNPFQAKLAESVWIAPSHFIAGGIALFLTPFQLSQKLRNNSRQLHRITGYIYVSAVLISGIAGLLMSFKASGGWIAQLGFFALAVSWLTTTILALFHAIKGNIWSHQRWVYRSIALTAAAITLRLFLGIGLGVLQLPFLTVYVPTAWLCWIINLTICEAILYYQQRQETKLNPELVV